MPPRPPQHGKDVAQRQRPVANADLAPTVLFESDEALCVAKPAGVSTQPGKGHLRDTLLNGAFALRGEVLGTLGPDCDWGLMHRLDRDVAGVVLLAKTQASYARLRTAFERREIQKRYLAVVQGAPPAPTGVCTRPITEAIRGDMKVALCQMRGGETAETRWRTLARVGKQTVLEVEPVTGRLHQIRVHLATLGCPIVGDRMYRADAPPNTSRLPPGRTPEPMLLHAWKLGFPSIGSDALTWVTCPLPPAMAAACPGMA